MTEVMESNSACMQLEKEVTVEVLLWHLENEDKKVQQSALSLIYVIFTKADRIKRNEVAVLLVRKKYLDIIKENEANIPVNIK